MALYFAYWYIPVPTAGGAWRRVCKFNVPELYIVHNPQADRSASSDLLAVRDAHIAALQTELRGKDRILQAKTKVGAKLLSTCIHKCTMS